MKTILVLAITIVLVMLWSPGVTACDPTPPPSPLDTPTVAPTETPLPTETVAPTETPRPTETQTVEPTATGTVEPTQTVQPTEKPRRHNTPEPTETVAPTQVAIVLLPATGDGVPSWMITTGAVLLFIFVALFVGYCCLAMASDGDDAADEWERRMDG